jgi:uncharacterized membrane protein YphA (DoxX/SURF4 family)
MNKVKIFAAIAILIRLLLGFLFIYSALDKILYPAKFAEVIYNYRLLPVELLNICAIIVPWIEITIGITLLLGVWIDASALLLSGLTIVFIGLLLSAIVRGLNIECGCFSLDSEGSLVSWKRIFEDVLILIGGLYLLWYQFEKQILFKSQSSLE